MSTPTLLADDVLARARELRRQLSGGFREEAVKSLRPPPHFSIEAALAQQGRVWTADKLEAALRQTTETIKSTRLRPRLEAELADQLVARIARSL